MSQTCVQLICIRPPEKEPEKVLPPYSPELSPQFAHNGRKKVLSPSLRKARRPIFKKTAALLLSATVLTGFKGSIGAAGQALAGSGLSGVIVSGEAGASAMSSPDLGGIFSSLLHRYISSITLDGRVGGHDINGGENILPVSLIPNENTLCHPANTPAGRALVSALIPFRAHEGGTQVLTLYARSGSGYDFWEGVSVQNGTSHALDIEKYINRPITWIGKTDQPLVLIIHTHSCESYSPGIYDAFEPDSSDRSTDTNHNVVRVGREIAQLLEANGIGVVHDMSLYDYHSYSGAYARSLAATKEMLEKYPSIKIVIDVHRDALDSGSLKYKLVSQEGASQVMLLVGTNGEGLHPNWEENFALAVKLQKRMNDKYPLLARPIKLTQSSYNQQTAPGAFILEVGANGNTLSEALLAAGRFADCLVEVIKNSIE